MRRRFVLPKRIFHFFECGVGLIALLLGCMNCGKTNFKFHSAANSDEKCEAAICGSAAPAITASVRNGKGQLIPWGGSTCLGINPNEANNVDNRKITISMNSEEASPSEYLCKRVSPQLYAEAYWNCEFARDLDWRVPSGAFEADPSYRHANLSYERLLDGDHELRLSAFGVRDGRSWMSPTISVRFFIEDCGHPTSSTSSSTTSTSTTSSTTSSTVTTTSTRTTTSSSTSSSSTSTTSTTTSTLLCPTDHVELWSVEPASVFVGCILPFSSLQSATEYYNYRTHSSFMTNPAPESNTLNVLAYRVTGSSQVSLVFVGNNKKTDCTSGADCANKYGHSWFSVDIDTHGVASAIQLADDTPAALCPPSDRSDHDQHAELCATGANYTGIFRYSADSDGGVIGSFSNSYQVDFDFHDIKGPGDPTKTSEAIDQAFVYSAVPNNPSGKIGFPLQLYDDGNGDQHIGKFRIKKSP